MNSLKVAIKTCMRTGKLRFLSQKTFLEDEMVTFVQHSFHLAALPWWEINFEKGLKGCGCRVAVIEDALCE